LNEPAANAHRIVQIRQAIETALSPSSLDIVDESHLHAGHAGARGGLGHFRVRIVSNAFDGLTLIKRHRLVYSALGDLMTTDIHALSIDARTPAECTT
jgi:BolA protein